MRIVNLSYVSITEYEDPESWLKRINYFTGILEEMAKSATVFNFHSIHFDGVVTQNGVEYHFKSLSFLERWFPVALHSYLLKLKPDVVIVHGLLFPWQVFLLQRRLGRRIRLFIQHHAERPSHGWRRFFQKRIDSRVEGYFFSAKGLGQLWIEENLISDASKIHEVMEVSSVFSPMDRVEAIRQTDISGSPVYLWVGGLNPNKDPLILINAFLNFLPKHPKASLYLIYQTDQLEENINKLLKDFPEYRMQIRMVGNIPHHRMVHWYGSTDFIISTSHYEGSGTAVCEAMSCGCIPILTDIPSFSMMTHHGTVGFLFPAGDLKALENALEQSIEIDKDDMRRRVIQQFNDQLSFEAISKKILNVVGQSLKK